jgi:chemotaxis protein CheD
MSASERGAARLAQLKAAPRERGEARFFFHDTHFASNAVKVLPGEWFVADEPLLITTTLGSCIAVCLWDRVRRIGGLNHFMLPDGDAADASGRYGGFAMELLINALMKRGAARGALEAKVFGGGQVIGGMSSLNVGERNARFALDYLRAERIPVLAKDVLDIYPRKVCFLPDSGKAMVKRLASANTDALLTQERAAAQAAPAVAGGSIDLF